MESLARAAGFVGQLRNVEARPYGEFGTSVNADLYWKGVLVLPPERFRAVFDYETGLLRRLHCSRFIELPLADAPLFVDAESYADRFVMSTLARPGIQQISRIWVQLVIESPIVREDTPTYTSWVADRLRAAAEEQRGVYQVMCNAIWPGGVYSARYDPANGELVEWHDDRGAPGSAVAMAPPIPTSEGPLKVLLASKTRTVTGSLDLVKDAGADFHGKRFGLVRGSAAWSIEYNQARGLVKFGGSLYRPSVTLRKALDRMTQGG